MRFVVIPLIMAATGHAFADNANASIFLRHGSTLYSDAVPIKAFEDDLRGIEKPERGNHALTFNRVEIGVSYRNFELARFMREDYVFHFSPDTMNIVYWDKNKIPIPEGKTYDVYLDVQHIKTDGWRIGYNLGFEDSNIRLSLNYFTAEDLLYGSLEGQITVEDGDIDGGNLDVLYYYHEDYLLDRRNIQVARGTGYSMSLEADLRLRDGWRIELDIYDALGQIYWDAAPYTEATVASTSTYYDSDGYARRAPMMVGMQSYTNLTQNLPVHYQFSLSKQLIGPWGLVYTRETYDKVDFDRLLLRHRLFDGMDLLTGYDFTMEAAWVALHSDAISLQVATDDWVLVDSKALVLRLSTHWSF